MESGSKALRAPDIVKSIRVIVSPLALQTHKFDPVIAHECLGVKGSWAKIASVGLVESHREGGGEVSIEQRFFLTSLPCDAVRFAQAVREHWGVEHALHWVLDVSFREDDCRIRQGNGAQNMAVLRHMALHLLRRESGHTRGIKARRKRAGWDRDYLFQVLTG
jgi:predicted transposase YbfD/YdcC